MKKARMLRALAALLVCTTLLGLFPAGSVTVFGEDEVPADITFTLDPEKIITENLIGLGFQWDGYPHADTANDTSPSHHVWDVVMSQEDWDTVHQRVDYMKPKFVRMMLKSDWWYRYGTDANGNPNLDFNTEEMQIVYDNMLDYCQENGITVMFGEWDPYDNPNWEWSLAECLDELVNRRGYTCIKYVNIQNCLRTSEMEQWRVYVRNLYDEMEARGLLGKVEILGPDDQINNPGDPVSDFLQRVVDDPELSEMMGAYESHHYTPYQAQIAAMRNYIDTNDGKNKPFIIGETGIMPKKSSGKPNTGADSNTRVYEYSYGVEMAQYTAAMVNGGAAAVSVWDLDDAMHWGESGQTSMRRWGFWNILGSEVYNDPEDEEIRPWFYTYALMCRNFPDGSIILDSGSFDQNELQAMTALVPQADGTYGLSIMAVNRSSAPKTFSFNLPTATGPVNLMEYQYFDGERLEDENGFPVATAAHENVNMAEGTTITVAANGVGFLASLEAGSTVAIGNTIAAPTPYYSTQPIADQVIVDNTDGGFTTGGSWVETGEKVGYHGANYLTDGTNGIDPASTWARWTPELKAGYYDVYLSWPRARKNATTLAPVTVHHAKGTSEVIMNQGDYQSGKWHLAGTYPFEAGSTGGVTLFATGYGQTVADAARFVYRGSEPPTDAPKYQVILNTVEDSSFLKATGAWTKSSYYKRNAAGYPDRYGVHFYNDGNAGKGSKAYTYTPRLEYEGLYRVEIFYPTGDFAQGVPVDILYKDEEGTATSTVMVDQSVNGGRWNTLGEYVFSKGDGGSVTIRNQGTSKTVAANAMRFVLLEPYGQEETLYNEVVDDLENWDMLFSRSANLMFEERTASGFDDITRIKRTGADSSSDVPAEIVYALSGLKRLKFSAYFDTSYDGGTESLLCYISPNGYSWQAQPLEIEPISGGEKKKFELQTTGEFPEGTQFVKIVLQNNTLPFYPQIGKVSLYNEPAVLECTAINLHETSVNINAGNTSQLTYALAPMDCAATGLTWASSAPGVATVDTSGMVTALAQGSATITVTTAGGKQASTVVNVLPNNLALGKTVTASGTGNGLLPANAVDGDYATRWSSGNANSGWFKVDMGESTTMAEVVIAWGGSAGVNFYIEVCDTDSPNNSDWTTAYHNANHTGTNYTQTIRFANAVTGRYIRMRAATTTNKYGLGISEFEVYGPSNYVPITEITMPAERKVTLGDEVALNAQALPENATYGNIVYTTSNSAIVTTVNNKLVAVGTGECTITATADGVSAQTKVTVLPLPESNTEKPVQTQQGTVVLSIANVDAGAIPAGTTLEAADIYNTSQGIEIPNYKVEMAFDTGLRTADSSLAPLEGNATLHFTLPTGFGQYNLKVYRLNEGSAEPVSIPASLQQVEGKWVASITTSTLGTFLLVSPTVNGTVTTINLENVEGTAGTEFLLPFSVTGIGTEIYRSAEAVLRIPNGLSLVGVEDGGILTGGTLSAGEVKDGLLRLAYINTAQDTGLSVPADGEVLFSLRLALEQDAETASEFTVAAESFTALKSTAGASETDPNAYESVPFDVTAATSKITISEGAPGEITAVATELYTGDGVDLVPAGSKAVSVVFTGVTKEQDIKFGDIQLYYNEKRSTKTNQVVFVCLVDEATPLNDMNNGAGYTIAATGAQSIVFGKTNDQPSIDAQDALNILDAWLRKNEVETDKQILAMNVTADARIDTADVLAIIDNFINNREFAVVTK